MMALRALLFTSSGFSRQEVDEFIEKLLPALVGVRPERLLGCPTSGDTESSVLHLPLPGITPRK